MMNCGEFEKLTRGCFFFQIVRVIMLLLINNIHEKIITKRITFQLERFVK